MKSPHTPGKRRPPMKKCHVNSWENCVGTSKVPSTAVSGFESNLSKNSTIKNISIVTGPAGVANVSWCCKNCRSPIYPYSSGITNSERSSGITGRAATLALEAALFKLNVVGISAAAVAFDKARLVTTSR